MNWFLWKENWPSEDQNKRLFYSQPKYVTSPNGIAFLSCLFLFQFYLFMLLWCVFYAVLRSSSVTHALVVGRTILFSFWPSSRRNNILSNWPTDFDQRWRWFVWSKSSGIMWKLREPTVHFFFLQFFFLGIYLFKFVSE